MCVPARTKLGGVAPPTVRVFGRDKYRAMMTVLICRCLAAGMTFDDGEPEVGVLNLLVKCSL